MTKEEAKAEVRHRIRQLITILVGPPPAWSTQPFHLGHKVSPPQLNLGLTDYRNAGSWFQMVSCYLHSAERFSP
jgi:hypothetical protein